MYLSRVWCGCCSISWSFLTLLYMIWHSSLRLWQDMTCSNKYLNSVWCYAYPVLVLFICRCFFWGILFSELVLCLLCWCNCSSCPKTCDSFVVTKPKSVGKQNLTNILEHSVTNLFWSCKEHIELFDATLCLRAVILHRGVTICFRAALISRRTVFFLRSGAIILLTS